MDTPKRQHWVPRFYLKQFAVPSGKNPDQVWIFGRKHGSEPALTNIANIATSKHLYSPRLQDGSRDPRFEQRLSKVESLLATIWSELANGFLDLADQDIRRSLALYLAFQFLRHPDRRALHDSIHSQFAELIRNNQQGPQETWRPVTVQRSGRSTTYSAAEVASYVNADCNDFQAAWISNICLDVRDCAIRLMEKRWSVVFIDSPLFITSDHPFYVLNPEMSRHQLLGKDAMLHFPISPTRILVLDDLNEPRNQYYYHNDKVADEFNCSTWVNTDGFMISSRNVDDVLSGIVRYGDMVSGKASGFWASVQNLLQRVRMTSL